MPATWDSKAPGVLTLPSGRLVRGRGLRRPRPDGPDPDFGLYLQGRRPPSVPWESVWVRWPDFLLPVDRTAGEHFRTAWRRAPDERVEVACSAGIGRTGTTLACLAVLDGLSPDAAVEYVRRNYDRRSVETPWQRWYVRQFHAREAI
ncbi:protein-tyrosine phosphatase family protein [Nocardiopsis sp. RSe5-2]|uniref:Protein-tyrosine phosphatase family protein n=1 Tax=Nocardiopsis endophytica TaxID=3018445 RepID=A0ABT4U3F2_9ACTN|nr:protein-tyrosine phosphatase family protein [Nocardiopsis endophytica]MDA2811455.1 protein-tyrosine phosphatase family protein [Nocardiopsis endophytica]